MESDGVDKAVDGVDFIINKASALKFYMLGIADRINSEDGKRSIIDVSADLDRIINTAQYVAESIRKK